MPSNLWYLVMSAQIDNCSESSLCLLHRGIHIDIWSSGESGTLYILGEPLLAGAGIQWGQTKEGRVSQNWTRPGCLLSRNHPSYSGSKTFLRCSGNRAGREARKGHILGVILVLVFEGQARVYKAIESREDILDLEDSGYKGCEVGKHALGRREKFSVPGEEHTCCGA